MTIMTLFMHVLGKYITIMTLLMTVLGKYITIKKNDIDDSCLEEIAKRHPVSLALIQCQGERVTARALRDLFRECSQSLKVILNILPSLLWIKIP
jgi:hypothetical protein